MAECAAAEQEAGGRGAWLPIFICSLALPGVACPLHIFEPRYRLMMRRCIESGERRFGMCLPSDDTSGSLEECMVGGTELLIENYEQLPDGRAKIQAKGGGRFQIVERKQKDGYLVAKVTWTAEEDQWLEEGLIRASALRQANFADEQVLMQRRADAPCGVQQVAEGESGEPVDEVTHAARSLQICAWAAELNVAARAVYTLSDMRQQGVSSPPPSTDVVQLFYWAIAFLPFDMVDHEKYKLVFELKLYERARELRTLAKPLFRMMRARGMLTNRDAPVTAATHPPLGRALGGG
eukprot:SAG11_NODE_1745_length_4334_cov_2.520425_2_plen_293_part_01